MLDKKKVVELYIKGYNSSEISKIVDGSKSSVIKCIQRNTKENDKLIHKRNRSIIKDSEKAIKRTNNRSISDSQLLKWNRQSYKTDKKTGDIVYCEECDAPIDLTKKFKNVDFFEYKKTFLYSKAISPEGI